MHKIYPVLTIIIIIFLASFALGEEEIITLDSGFTSQDIYELSKELVDAYPDILRLEVLGYTNGDNPIYVLIMTQNPEDVSSKNKTYVSKMHFFIEGGIHSRENVSPIMLLKIIETYAKDYQDESLLKEVNMKSYLSENVLHILPLTNPDGYDLSNFGLSALTYKARQLATKNDLRPYEDLKANINGVDLNRNFPSVYYDINDDQFKDIWNLKDNAFVSNDPSGSFYPGDYPASEIETKILMDYIIAYDFRNYLSFHSRGEIIYYYKWMLSQHHNKQSKTLAEGISEDGGNGYAPYYGGIEESSTGYLTDYSAMVTLKPSVTIESVDGEEDLPAHNGLIIDAYYKNLFVPLKAIDHGRAIGYHPFRLYLNNRYVRDYYEEVYGQAMAEKLGGILIEGQGVPDLTAPDSHYQVSRLQALQFIMMKKGFEPIEVKRTFIDTDNYWVNVAKALGWINGFDNIFRPNDVAKVQEAYVMISNIFGPYPKVDHLIEFDYPVVWAKESIKVLLDRGILSANSLKEGPLTLEELKNLIESVKLHEEDG